MGDQDDKAEGSTRGGSGGAGLERAAFSLLREIVDLAADERDLQLAGHDPEVVARVREILDTDGDLAEPFAGGLPFPPTALGADDGGIRPEADGLGRIGPYRLLATLGEGGMGRVYLAEQGEPVERRVALKVIGPRFLDDHTRLRFQSERQALARLSHPHIAQLYEAGSIADGSPYFAMELVEGPPITRYCDEAHLDLRRRIELFLSVCDGVAHAHQKGILHRDLKPNNVLVCEVAGQPQPKVIDFGIAKAIDRPLVEATLLTHAMIGTPAYMSPEAVKDGQRVDTRSDVYSLGVLFYEMLVGVRPIEEREDHPLRVLSRIVDEEPSRPSSRWQELDEGTREVAAGCRGLATEAVLRALDGDLDWIVMKAIAKDPGRRYGSVSELAADLERMLRDEPVTARPPSTAYLLRKAVARNRGLVTAVVLVLLSLIAGLVARTIEANRARRAEASSEAMAEFLGGLFSSATPYGEITSVSSVGDLLDFGAQRIEAELHGDPLARAGVLHSIGTAYLHIGSPEKAERMFREALALRRQELSPDAPEVREALHSLGVLRKNEGNLGEAERLLREVLELDERSPPEEPEKTADTLFNLALIFLLGDRLEEAEAAARRSLDIWKSVPDPPAARARPIGVLADVAQRRGDDAEAERLCRQALDIWPPGSHSAADIHLGLGEILDRRGEHEEAIRHFRDQLEIRRRTRGETADVTLDARARLARSLARVGRLEEALDLLEPDLPRLLGGEDPRGHGVHALHDLGVFLRMEGRFAQAEPFLAAARDGWPHVLPEPEVAPEVELEVADATVELGLVYLATERTPEAAEAFEAAWETRRTALGEHHPKTAIAVAGLAEVARREGRLEDAERLYRQAVDDLAALPASDPYRQRAERGHAELRGSGD